MDLRQTIKSWGASDVGFFKLCEPVAGFSYGISIVRHLSDAVIDQIDGAPTHTYFHHYRTINTFLDQLSLKVGFALEEAGYRYLCIPASQTVDNAGKAGLFSHKAGARLAGLGSIGKNALFLSSAYGPRVRLATVLTDMPLKTGTPLGTDVCTGCNACVRTCPAMALTGKAYREGMRREELIDANACSDYMKQHFQKIGRGAVCGICIKACRMGGAIL